MSPSDDKVVVYYDGSCPKCVRDRENFERLAGDRQDDICWFDITGQDEHLKQLGIDPRKALTELHVRDPQRGVVSELEAYILLMQRVPLLKPLAWLIGLPGLRPVLANAYHRMVKRRLKREGRWHD